MAGGGALTYYFRLDVVSDAERGQTSIWVARPGYPQKQVRGRYLTRLAELAGPAGCDIPTSIAASSLD